MIQHVQAELLFKMNEIVIKASELKKMYRINKRSKGLFGHIANLVVPKYEDKMAVDGVSFEIKKGEIVGFIGSNGAGKSTTIKMLTGILYPSDGEITVAGFNPYKDRKKYVRNIGVVFGQKSQLAWDLPVIDSFELLKSIYKISDKEYNDNLQLYSELLDLNGFINQPVRQLSLGQRMRADIAAALLHSPQIIFFDEPTIGLDVLAKEKIRNFILYLKKEKQITMIFTTHDMSDIEKTCDHLIIIDNGEKIYDGSVNEMLTVYGRRRKIIVEFDEIVTSDIKLDGLEESVIVRKDDTNDNKWIFEFDSGDVKIDFLMKEIFDRYRVSDIKIQETDVENIVRDIYDGRIEVK